MGFVFGEQGNAVSLPAELFIDLRIGLVVAQIIYTIWDNWP